MPAPPEIAPRPTDAPPESQSNFEAPPTPVQTETNLADRANVVPQRPEQDTHSDVLPNCEINCNPSAPLPEQVALSVAQKLREALDRRDNHGNDPDVDRIRALLNDTSGHGDQISAAYKTLPGQRSLLDDLSVLPIEDKLDAITTLRSREGRSNEAVNLMTSINAIPEDRDVAERRVVETLMAVGSGSMTKFEKDFQNQHGTTISEALRSAGVSPEAMRAVEALRKPPSARTADDLRGLADFAVSKQNLELLNVALGGNTTQAQEARAALRENAEFISRVTDAFRGEQSNAGALVKLALYGHPTGEPFQGMDMLREFSATRNDPRLTTALDIVSHGSNQLDSTILRNTSGRSGLSNENIQNIRTAIMNTSAEERRAFSLGGLLHNGQIEPSSNEEKAALAFYRSTARALESMGNDRLQIELESELLRYRRFGRS